MSVAGREAERLGLSGSLRRCFRGAPRMTAAEVETVLFKSPAAEARRIVETA
ncbi:hypothetical protein [Actinoallomurus acaciae]|uniref:Uncharacterized protein n=1 Tax=Actinoallomurus acaciae TaxID=502577 RepID=A0ABV5YUR1_9ACTN